MKMLQAGPAGKLRRSATEKGHEIMSKLGTLTCLATLVLSATFAWASDTAKVNRSIAKEPVYQSKTPKYCLLTFGREGKTRVWLVFDSVPNPLVPGKDKDYLYVD